MTNKKLLVITLTAALSNNAFAVGAVSRACSFDKIPSSLQVTAAAFFMAIGGNRNVIQNLPYASQYEKERHFILESLTTDYVNTRYYLYAQADIYFIGTSANYYPEYRNTYGLYKTYASPGWDAETVSQLVLQDSRFKIYFENRGPLYSARAGNTDIVERLDWSPVVFKNFKVVGHHKYWDPVSKKPFDLPQTVAYDCNLTDFGVMHSGIFDR